ncbi:MAG TPA: hypothetical protein VGI39_35915 [Polyangiaceae bacterium]|jgi:hypothetical protein
MTARSTLAAAYCARAEYALHGANQLSLSAQRAPTREACEEGWSRVEAIVAEAESAAASAARAAGELEPGAPNKAAARAAQRGGVAARRARTLVEQRNHAYTFHTDPRFSFGEGWYVAAAALLAGVAIQIEPGTSGTLQAEEFLRGAQLSACVQPYRSRPRAVKQTTAIVADAFRADPRAASRKLRASFLGEALVPEGIVAWVAQKVGPAPRGKMVLLWVRYGAHHPGRNSTLSELADLSGRAERAGLTPVWIGDAVRDGAVPRSAVDLTLFWKEPLFRGLDSRRAQLQLFELLRREHRLVGQVGVTTAGMDGPALMGLPTMYLTDAPNVRMGAWVGAVPGYREIVRDGAYLERVDQGWSAWSAGFEA